MTWPDRCRCRRSCAYVQSESLRMHPKGKRDDTRRTSPRHPGKQATRQTGHGFRHDALRRGRNIHQYRIIRRLCPFFLPFEHFFENRKILPRTCRKHKRSALAVTEYHARPLPRLPHAAPPGIPAHRMLPGQRPAAARRRAPRLSMAGCLFMWCSSSSSRCSI